MAFFRHSVTHINFLTMSSFSQKNPLKIGSDLEITLKSMKKVVLYKLLLYYLVVTSYRYDIFFFYLVAILDFMVNGHQVTPNLYAMVFQNGMSISFTIPNFINLSQSA